MTITILALDWRTGGEAENAFQFHICIDFCVFVDRSISSSLCFFSFVLNRRCRLISTFKDDQQPAEESISLFSKVQSVTYSAANFVTVKMTVFPYQIYLWPQDYMKLCFFLRKCPRRIVSMLLLMLPHSSLLRAPFFVLQSSSPP